MSAFDEYRNFIKQIDERVNSLGKEHSTHMKCAKGCDMCCIQFSVFPVEYHYIKSKIEADLPHIKENCVDIDNPLRCALLHNHACTIYQHRPYICRTHGFPLINMNEDGDEWELSFCELNFTDVDDDYFDIDNVLEQDSVNSMLYMINKRFIAENQQYGYNEKTLIPIKNLIL